MKTENKTLAEFREARPFYKQIQDTPGLQWLGTQYSSANNHYLHPLANYEHVAQHLFWFGVMKRAIVLLTFIGIYTAMTKVWPVIRHVLGILASYGDDFPTLALMAVLALGIVAMIIIFLFTRLFNRIWNELSDAWVKVNWSSPDFYVHVLEIGGIDMVHFPDWMAAGGFNPRNQEAAPHDVKRRCQERLVELASEALRSESSGMSEFTINCDKQELTHFLETCKRFEIVPYETDPRPYYARAKTLLKKDKATASAK